MASLLVVDDDCTFGRILTQHLSDEGHAAEFASSVADAVDRTRLRLHDVIFLDVNLPDGSGLDAIPALRHSIWPAEIIIVTGFGSAESAELAMRCGAWDFILKGSSLQHIMLALEHALQYRRTQSTTPVPTAFRMPGLIGHSTVFRTCIDHAAHASRNDVNVLVSGETGTGKELFARAIHENSPRRESGFVVVDCAALPGSLVTGVLFGHEKGAFTGAAEKRLGLVEQANGGTLFLDEIGDMPLEVQKTLLRVLQERRFRPLGASREVSSDFRLVAATNRDLDAMVVAGTFRADLLFRLRALTVALPPLRERKDDIPLLVKHFLEQESRRRGEQRKRTSPCFMEAIDGYGWDGNVRELENAVVGAVSKAGPDPVLYPKHLPTHVRIPLARARYDKEEQSEMECTPPPAAFPRGATLRPLREMREQFEGAYLKELVVQCASDIETASRISGFSRPQIYALLRKHGLRLC